MSSTSSKPSWSMSPLRVGSLGKASLRFETPSPSESTQPKRSMVEVPTSPGQASGCNPLALSPYPSPSWSSHCVVRLGRASMALSQPSPSVSTQPRRLPWVELPAWLGQASGCVPAALSPKPSPSVSSHWVMSSGCESPTFAQPSRSVSKQPYVLFCHESPCWLTQPSGKLPEGLSP